MTLLETMFVLSIGSFLFGGVCYAMVSLQQGYQREEILNTLTFRGQRAMEKLVSVAQKALSDDPSFSFQPSPSGDGTFSGMQFSLIQSFAGGTVTYDPNRVFIWGDQGGTYPCRGMVMGRSTDVKTLFSQGKGTDNVLGTPDDRVNAATRDDIPFLETLILPRFAPRTGRLFTIRKDPGNDRRFTFVLRLNARNGSRGFLLDDDYMLTQTITLRQ